MVRSLFAPKSVWGGLAVLAMTGTVSAQWFPFGGGNNCGCAPRTALMGSAPIMQSANFSSYSAAQSVECGQPINCTVSQPVQFQAVAVQPMVQTVKVQALQPVVHPVYDTVQVTEYQAVQQKVQKPVVETKWVDQAVTEMRPVTQQRTVNVPTVDYQTVTEYKQVQKQVGYWATKTEPTGKVASCQYDNRPGMVGWMNRTGYDIRNAFTPTTKVSRTYVPQTMTCTVPCTKKVAVQGMKQVTYNVTSMVAQQTTRKVAVNTVRYVEETITAMKPVTVARTMQVGTRISYAPAGSATAGAGGNGGPTALTPTPETNARRQSNDRTASDPAEELKPDDFNRGNAPVRKISYPVEEHRHQHERGEVTETVIPSRPSLKTPSVVRVSQWVARTPRPSSPNLAKSAAISVAENAR